MKKTVNVSLADIQDGDLVTLKRTFGNGTTLVVTGKAETKTRYQKESVPVVRTGTSQYFHVSREKVMEAIRRYDNGLVDHEVVSITREIEVPELPTTLGSMIWLRVEGVSKDYIAMLVRRNTETKGLSDVWQSATGFSRPQHITEWQPVIPMTLAEPAENGWIQR